MHVLFVHKSFPGQFGHIARHLIQQEGFHCTFACDQAFAPRAQRAQPAQYIVSSAGIVQGLDALVTGQIKGGLFGPEGLTGPIGIASITAQSVNQGWLNYVFLVAILSVALGFTNLLPVPALDGGRIVVAVAEWVRRRPFDRKSELNFQRWGLVALLALAALISILDIQRIATGQFPGGH